jgi:SAM-dependent methyltransferase
MMSYAETYRKGDFLHYRKRMQWVKKRCRDRRVVDFGCGYGYVVQHLFEKGVNVFGVEINEYALENSVIPDRTFPYLPIEPGDFLVSWNVLDAVEDQSIAETLSTIFGMAERSYHVLCTDLEDKQSERYSEQGFFIRPIEWWLEICDPHVILVDYHSGKVYNTDKQLKMPLSLGMISE